MAFTNARFGAGVGPIYLDNVDCTGSEDNLTDCPSSAIFSCPSGHNEDAGVRCQSKLIQCSCNNYSRVVFLLCFVLFCFFFFHSCECCKFICVKVLLLASTRQNVLSLSMGAHLSDWQRLRWVNLGSTSKSSLNSCQISELTTLSSLPA